MGYTRAVYYAAAIALTSPAIAEEPYPFATGNTFYAACSDDSSDKITYCVSWVAGVAAGIASMDELQSVRTICAPQGSTNGQYKDIILAYIKNHPEQRHWQPSELSVMALLQAFPCPKK